MNGRRNMRKELIANSFGTNPLEGISYYNAEKRLENVARYHKTMELHKNTDELVDDITWEDLEMDQVFLRMNHTNSFIGEQVLYHRLHDLKNYSKEKTFDQFEKKLNFFEENPKERFEIETRLNDIGKRDDAYYLPEFLQNTELWSISNTFLLHVLQVLLVVSLVLAIAMNRDIFVIGFVGVAILNLTIYMRTKTKYEVYLNALSVFKQVYDFAKWMGKYHNQSLLISEEVKSAIQSLKKISSVILDMSTRKQNTLTGDVFAIVYDYVWGITLLDLATFNYIMKVIQNKKDDVWKLLQFAGELDSEIGVLSYRKSLGQWCKPYHRNTGIMAEGLAHPLLGSPVKNDFQLENRAIITGTNASGKSTFMKAVAINCILAQTVHTCTADQFALMNTQVMTCMSLRDDVLSGESYYFREAKYLKRMLDKIESGKQIFCVIDEILKGTNTKERIAASKAILDYLGKRDCLTLVATHDNELTENTFYHNYHFESIIQNSDISFDYRIREGVSTESNAIALLSLLGYPKEIVRQEKENIA